MRVIHIIPSAFDYFNDIRAAAFDVVERSSKFGVEAEAFTLQFTSTVPQNLQTAIEAAAPSREFKGMSSAGDLTRALSEFDVVHLHAPFLGAGRELLAWRRAHPQTPFVVTYYRSTVWADIFCVYIALFNRYYLSKLIPLASRLAFAPLSKFVRKPKGDDWIVVDTTDALAGHSLTEVLDEVQLDVEDRVAAKYALLYQSLLTS